MKNAVHQHFVIGCILAVVGGVVVWTLFVCNTFACLPSGTDRPDRPDGDAVTGRGSDQTELANHSSFRISAAPTAPLSPGLRVPLDLRLQNTNKTALSITELEVSVLKVDAPNSSDQRPCLVEDFTVDQVPDDLDLTLPAKANSSLSGLSLPSVKWPQVGLRNTSVNQDGCKDASLTLDFTASGAVAP